MKPSHVLFSTLNGGKALPSRSKHCNRLFCRQVPRVHIPNMGSDSPWSVFHVVPYCLSSLKKLRTSSTLKAVIRTRWVSTSQIWTIMRCGCRQSRTGDALEVMENAYVRRDGISSATIKVVDNSGVQWVVEQNDVPKQSIRVEMEATKFIVKTLIFNF